MYKYLLLIISTFLIFYSCSDNNNDDLGVTEVDSFQSEISISGIVADGYLVSADVWIDLNGNYNRDEGEPFTRSTKNGKYTLQVENKEYLNHPVIAKAISGVTIDEDEPNSPITGDYLLIAAPSLEDSGENTLTKNITPISTLVAQLTMHSNDLSIDQAREEVLDWIKASTNNNFDEDVLNEDYIAQSSDRKYQELHEIAKKVRSNLQVTQQMVESEVMNTIGSNTDDLKVTGIVQSSIQRLVIEEISRNGTQTLTRAIRVPSADSIKNKLLENYNSHLEIKKTREELSDKESVDLDYSKLTAKKIKNENTNLSHVIGNLSLETEGENGSTIKWTSSNSSAVDKDGNVTRNSYSDGSVSLTLTAEIEKGSVKRTIVFPIIVYRNDPSIEDQLIADMNKVDFNSIKNQNIDGKYIISNLSALPTKGSIFNSDIKWTSDNAAITDAGVVNRPDVNGSPINVNLTAVATIGTQTKSKTFELQVYPEIEFKFSLGTHHSCAVNKDGQAKCWGNGGYGKLGLGNREHKHLSQAQVISFPTNNNSVLVKDIVVAGHHTCSIFVDGTLNCWGWNKFGQLAIGSRAGDRIVPTAVPFEDVAFQNRMVPQVVEKVVLGQVNICVLLQPYGQIRCAGRTDQGQLANGSSEYRTYTPIRTHWGAQSHFQDIELGDGLHVCGKRGSKFLCWAYNDKGQLGVGSDQYVPSWFTSEVNIGTNVRPHSFSLGLSHTCVISNNVSTNEKTLLCMGDNSRGQLGIADPNTINKRNTPQIVDLGTGESAIHVAIGSEHSCAILASNKVKCWGYNHKGQLGLGHTNNEFLPQEVNLGSDLTPKKIFASGNSTCIQSTEDKFKCWGENTHGHLGYSDNIDRGTTPNTTPNNLPYLQF